MVSNVIFFTGNCKLHGPIHSESAGYLEVSARNFPVAQLFRAREMSQYHCGQGYGWRGDGSPVKHDCVQCNWDANFFGINKNWFRFFQCCQVNLDPADVCRSAVVGFGLVAQALRPFVWSSPCAECRAVRFRPTDFGKSAVAVFQKTLSNRWVFPRQSITVSLKDVTVTSIDVKKIPKQRVWPKISPQEIFGFLPRRDLRMKPWPWSRDRPWKRLAGQSSIAQFQVPTVGQQLWLTSFPQNGDDFRWIIE